MGAALEPKIVRRHRQRRQAAKIANPATRMRSSKTKHCLLPAVGTVGRNKRTASSARPLAAVTRLKSDRGLGQGERVTRYCGERLNVSGGLISIPACAAMKLWLRSHTSLTAAAKLGRIKNPAKSYRKHVCFWMPRTRSGRRGGMQETLEKHPACGAG